ncbi:MAG: response regulator, partial [Phycisphaerae bacterium]|nr:response regulator [Phycisphaerae bacterium]
SEAENVNAIQTVRRNAQHLLRILNDILDLSKVEAGKLEIERLPCSPFQVLNEAVSVMRVRAEAKGLTLNLEYLGSIPEQIVTDSTRLQQILFNLIGNALKFTESGGVRVVTRFLASSPTPAAEPDYEAHGAFLQFDVIDTGIGMTPAQLDQVFDPFMQADSSTTRRFGGTGLGLAISRRLAELLGGTIAVESCLGEGSCFRCIIATGPLDGIRMVDNPSKAALIVPEDTPPSADVGTLDCRILLAEDGQDNQRLISFVLKKAGAEVTVVENGEAAMNAALTACEQGRAFDVILMDMQMPVLDGYEATSLLRRKGYAGPIIALTAHAMASDRRKCLDAGCDDYAVKPIDRKQLFEMINRYTKAEHPAATDV